MPLTIVLNGQSRTFTELGDSPSFDSLIQQLGLKTDRVAVERNGELVPRSTWAETSLIEGDLLELVHFVGGGTRGSK